MKYLALTIMSKAQSKLIHELARFIKAASCSVLEMRWLNPGEDALAYCLIAGNWNAIAKLESGLPNFERKYEMQIHARRIEKRETQLDRLPYSIFITSQDHPGVLEEVMGFLAAEDIEVMNLSGETYLAKHTGVTMVSLTIEITIPTSYLISDFRERFILFCDELNIDATVEPEK